MTLTKHRFLAITALMCVLALSVGCSFPMQKSPVAEVAVTQSGWGLDKPEKPGRIRELWTLPLPRELQGRLYETGIVPGDPPVVLATTPQHVLRITGEIAALLNLRRQGAIGERALLPSPVITTGRQETSVGILLHDHHAIAGFKLVSLDGKTLVELTDPRHFHYRLAPDGRSFVGIDAGGEHTALTAETVIYRFFDSKGKPIGEIRSSRAGSIDSSYSPDGKSFLINSKRDGLSSYDPITSKRLWTIPMAIKFFAPANGSVGRVIVSHAENRTVAELYEADKPRWTVNLERFGVRENVRNVAISPGGEIAAVSGSTLLLIVGAERAEPLGRFQVEGEFTINSVSVSDSGMIALGMQQARVEDGKPSSGQIVVLDKTGKVVFRQQTAHQRSNAWIPTVQFDALGQSLLIRTLDAVSLLSTR